MRLSACLGIRACNVRSCCNCSTLFLHCCTLDSVVYFDFVVGSSGCLIGTVGYFVVVGIDFALY